MAAHTNPPFTVEQEARIREIIGSAVASLQRNQSRRHRSVVHISVTPSDIFADKVRKTIVALGGAVDE